MSGGMTRRFAIGTLAGAIFATAACSGRRRESMRYRITLEVDTPSGLKTGSSVLENRSSTGSSRALREIDKGGGEAYGEAPVVDLGEGRLLIAVLQDPDFNRRLYYTALDMLLYPDLQPPLPGGFERLDWTRAYPQANEAKPFAVIRPEDYPMLVTFADPADPTTPAEVKADALDMAFGAGFQLRRITAQVTDEPITSGEIEKYLPWLSDQRGSLVKLKSLDRADNPITHRLNKASFVRRD